MTSSLIYLSFFLGFSSAAAQLLVMRSLVAALYGNEFVLVLVLASWLIGVAAGSMTLGMLKRSLGTGERVTAVFFILAGALIPLTILASRLVRSFLGIPPGMLMDIVQVAGVAFLLVLPLSALYGALFPLLSGVDSRTQDRAVAPRVYALEAAGFVAGGVIMTFVFLPFFRSLNIAFFLFGLHAIVAAKLLRRGRLAVVALFLVGAVSSISGGLRLLDVLSQAAQWPGFRLIEGRDTVYGNLQLLEKGGAKSLFENGLLVATTGDALSSEENVHYALLAHSDPKRLLMVGGGLGGGLAEALKHPGLAIDYVELDPSAIDLARRNIPRAAQPMADQRVRVMAADGRRVIRTARSGQYDVVILNLSDPLTLLVNRYYTEEFFRAVRRILKPDGILALSVTSSENSLNKEGWNYLRILRRTLGMVFTDVRSVPGDRHIFLSAQAFGVISLAPLVLTERLNARHIKTEFVRDYYYNFRLEPGRVLQAETALLGKAPVNSDTRPSAFLAALVFWSTHFQSGFSGMVDAVKNRGLALLGLPLVIGLGAAFARRRRLFVAGLVVTAAGFCLMIYQLAVILGFQSFYGYAYAGVGLITAAFMAGASLGALWAKRQAPEQARIRLQSVVVYAAVFALFLAVFLPQLANLNSDVLVACCLGVLSLAAGIFAGVQFTLAVQYAAEDVRSPGILYAWDVIGATIGALLGGIFLIPLWGVAGTGLFCALVQAAVLLALFG